MLPLGEVRDLQDVTMLALGWLGDDKVDRLALTKRLTSLQLEIEHASQFVTIFGSHFPDGRIGVTVCSCPIGSDPSGGCLVLRLYSSQMALALERPGARTEAQLYSFDELLFPAIILGEETLRVGIEALLSSLPGKVSALVQEVLGKADKMPAAATLA